MDPKNDVSKIGVSRRSFLSGAALMGIGAAFGLSGCSPKEQADSSTGAMASSSASSVSAVNDLPTEIAQDAEQLEYDVVVIGAGTSGSCAALAAAKAGAKTLIVEKTDITGGLSNYSTFIVGAQTSLQKEFGYDITSDFLYTVHREYYKGTCYLPLVRNIFDNTTKTIDWLRSSP